MRASNRTRHYYLACLLARITAFAFLVCYSLHSPRQFDADLRADPFHLTPLTVVWAALILSMLFRLFPSRVESLGCQKEFAGRFRPTGKSPSMEEVRQADRGALWVLLSWLALNALVLLAYAWGWVNQRFLVCLAGFYGVCDIICILFFCPFQSWMMHNRCCTTCRVYNWDYLMICTPLLAIRGPLSLSACLLALVLVVRWELTYHRRRERFFVSSNEALRCDRCQEHLCRYKRALAAHRPRPQESQPQEGPRTP